VKDIYVDGGKLARNGRKTAIFVSRKFWFTFSTLLSGGLKGFNPWVQNQLDFITKMNLINGNYCIL
jgi:hypothetical protein